MAKKRQTKATTKPAKPVESNDDDEKQPKRFIEPEDCEAGFSIVDPVGLAAIRACDFFEITAKGVRCHKAPRAARASNNPFAVTVAVPASYDVELPKGTVSGIPQGTKFDRDDRHVVTFQKSLRKGDAISLRTQDGLIELCAQRIAGVFVFACPNVLRK